MSQTQSLPKRAGRPRVSERRSTVCTWLPNSQHDRLIKLANQREISVSALLRSIVYIAIKPK